MRQKTFVRSARPLARRAVLLAALSLAAGAPTRGQQPPLAADPTAALLQEILRVNTSNPPGVTQGVADVLGPRFRALGFEVHVIPTPDSGKVHFIARLKGDGSKRPLLLAAHVDVVGVEREKWSVDPFGGVVKDGSVYGRGAIDFKGGAAVFARAVMMLAENKVPLARDVVFLAEADEEGQPMNTSWLAREHWALIDCEFALNEGGWIIKRPDGRVRYVSISTADKSSVGITLTARGTSTHSSMPRPDNAIFTLGKALAKLADFDFPVQLTPSTRQFFLALAKTSEPPMSEYFRDLVSDDPARVKRADAEISKDPLLHAIMRNTIAPTLISGGFRTNVIPGSAEATINVRVIPGTNAQDIVREFERAIADPRVEVRAGGGGRGRGRGGDSAVAAAGRGAGGRGGAGDPAAGRGAGRGTSQPSPENTDLYETLVREARTQWPEAEVTPYLFQAGTDAGAWRSRGIPVYGIYPYPISADELTRMHGNDERVSIESLRQGTAMIYRTLVAVAGRR
jgi:acetylornithine deacetylase/succinyl-diaminopimelate desuccinylase-like protein